MPFILLHKQQTIANIDHLLNVQLFLHTLLPCGTCLLKDCQCAFRLALIGQTHIFQLLRSCQSLYYPHIIICEQISLSILIALHNFNFTICILLLFSHLYYKILSNIPHILIYIILLYVYLLALTTPVV